MPVAGYKYLVCYRLSVAQYNYVGGYRLPVADINTFSITDCPLPYINPKRLQITRCAI